MVDKKDKLALAEIKKEFDREQLKLTEENIKLTQEMRDFKKQKEYLKNSGLVDAYNAFMVNLRQDGVPWLKGNLKIEKPKVITSKIFGDQG